MGAQHLRVPYGLIRALCYPGGVRLPQRVSRVRPVEPDVDATVISYQTFGPNTTFVPAETTAITVIPKPDMGPMISSTGNLSNEAYRFFRGSAIPNSGYFQCRGCRVETYVKENKLLHMRECRQLIQATTEILKRDKCCVVCNHRTEKECWTLPLCSDVCIVKWRFSIPDTWWLARNVVLFSEPHLLRKK